MDFSPAFNDPHSHQVRSECWHRSRSERVSAFRTSSMRRPCPCRLRQRHAALPSKRKPSPLTWTPPTHTITRRSPRRSRRRWARPHPSLPFIPIQSLRQRRTQPLPPRRSLPGLRTCRTCSPVSSKCLLRSLARLCDCLSETSFPLSISAVS